MQNEILSQTSKKIFSIVLLAYNQADSIEQAILSILRQDFSNYELIIIDDNSSDNTPIICQRYAEQDNRIKFIRHSTNKSSHAARCTGAKNATGLYTLFLDGDDYFDSNALSQLYNEVILKEEFDICEFPFKFQPSKSICVPSEYPKDLPRIEYFCSRDVSVTIWNKLYKTDLVKLAFSNMKEDYINFSDDYYESICIAYYTKKFIQKNIIFVNYNVGNGVSTKQNSINTVTKIFDSIYIAIQDTNSFFENHTYNRKSEIIQSFEERLLSISIDKIEEVENIEDKAILYILLTKYFDINILKSKFIAMYDKYQKYNKGFFSIKNLCKTIYHVLKPIKPRKKITKETYKKSL